MKSKIYYISSNKGGFITTKLHVWDSDCPVVKKHEYNGLQKWLCRFKLILPCNYIQLYALEETTGEVYKGALHKNTTFFIIRRRDGTVEFDTTRDDIRLLDKEAFEDVEKYKYTE